ncbi:hypothetical protein SAMN05192558_103227 [Actinokineospora alba]|uniref:Nuclease-related domain-containing protein n=1 Tax=Actinokineospora alba TaxID=504798 RepID=A0A1H0JVD4_9PSEU|nr:hypothetical protein [Actinokineospora alba]TDP68152.1 hypothetical protein C8E96_3715 [Actinokineospora alba]SDH93254.1 hypothetical protein SAMN05421871_102822 [Actinokineospora alba]SDO47519.1 hypothetical protein SAMN05192558_103227 [Actinokineospora alba]
MRLVRVGGETSTVGTDLRAALASWGRGDAIVGGVAVLDVQPPGCPGPIDAVVVMPRGVLVIVGVDLPDPAVRLDAPLAGQWTTDGWPLVRPDGATNPAAEALAATSAVTALLQAERTEPVPVGTVVAIGPYVSQVSQPTPDLVRGVRILHPEPRNLMTAAKELATHTRTCTVNEVRQILAAVHPEGPALDNAELAAEGFVDTAARDAAATTTFIPRTVLAAHHGKHERDEPTSGLRWLPIVATILIAILLATGIAVAISSANKGSAGKPENSTSEIPVDGVAFTAKGSVEHTDCAAHAYGDVRTWLEKNGCARLIRGRFEATSDGKPVAVLVSVLRFTKSASATELRAVADKPGAGGIVDQGAQGVAWPGAHQPAFESAAYASGREGNSLKLVQAVWLDKKSNPDDPALRSVVTKALQLTLAG